MILCLSMSTSQTQDFKTTGRITIDQPFWPRSETLASNMDRYVQSNLGSNIKCRDSGSPLVQQAVLAGAYLGLTFPALQEAQSTPQLPNGFHPVDKNTEDTIKKQIVKFSVIRFDGLSQVLVDAMRNIDGASNEQKYREKVIGAAGTLICQLDHVKQGFRNGKLQLLCVSLLSSTNGGLLLTILG
jgi:hypothetical protein